MFKRNTFPVWLGILVLSSIFLMGQETWELPPCTDMDGDGFGAVLSLSCQYPFLDCDDDDPDINPLAIEIAGNGIDENCDGSDVFGSDFNFLASFYAQDGALMIKFLMQNPDIDLGYDETIYGAIGGFCQWTLGIQEPGTGMNLYDYQAYNESGTTITGQRSGTFDLGIIMGEFWNIMGTLELSGTLNGWIYDLMPMNGMSGPIIGARTWYVCDYDNGCTNSPGDTTGLSLFDENDLL